MSKINTWLKKLDKAHLEWLGILVIAGLLSPIIYLNIRDGIGGGVFPFHDQLDETILSYVFGARYFGKSVFEQLMCGVESTGLTASAPLFVPLYGLFSVYIAFLIQYIVVVTTAFFSMYFCVRAITDSSVSSFVAATLFSCLPFLSVYGNVVAGVPLIILCFLNIEESKGKKTALCLLGSIYYALTAHIVLSGWVTLGAAGVFIIVLWIKNKKFPVKTFLLAAVLFVSYVLINIRLIIQTFIPSDVVSHRVEFRDQTGTGPFVDVLKGVFFSDDTFYGAHTKHMPIYIVVALAIVLFAVKKDVRKYLKAFIACACSLIVFGVTTAALSSYFIQTIGKFVPAAFKSFQFDRVFYFLPALWYILMGISIAVIWEALKERVAAFGIVLIAVFSFFLFLRIEKGGDGIIYQNVNQINNGGAVTGYITMKTLYCEPLMKEIEDTIGLDMKDYRVAHIGISPVASLMHGFYTIDGYSNNYSLEYKHLFREIIAGELELNDYLKDYFDGWGSRCYIFYHEWGDSYYLRKGFGGKITDLRLDFEKMKELNCRYIFTAGEIIEPEQYGLEYMGYYCTDESFFGIYLYKIN